MLAPWGTQGLASSSLPVAAEAGGQRSATSAPGAASRFIPCLVSVCVGLFVF